MSRAARQTMLAVHQFFRFSSLAAVLLLVGKPTGATAADLLSAIKPEGST
jgi:hypothetical protein